MTHRGVVECRRRYNKQWLAKFSLASVVEKEEVHRIVLAHRAAERAKRVSRCVGSRHRQSHRTGSLRLLATGEISGPKAEELSDVRKADEV